MRLLEIWYDYEFFLLLHKKKLAKSFLTWTSCIPYMFKKNAKEKWVSFQLALHQYMMVPFIFMNSFCCTGYVLFSLHILYFYWYTKYMPASNNDIEGIKMDTYYFIIWLELPPHETIGMPSLSPTMTEVYNTLNASSSDIIDHVFTCSMLSPIVGKYCKVAEERRRQSFAGRSALWSGDCKWIWDAKKPTLPWWSFIVLVHMYFCKIQSLFD